MYTLFSFMMANFYANEYQKRSSDRLFAFYPQVVDKIVDNNTNVLQIVTLIVLAIALWGQVS